jgi:membrane protein required for colicin V production
MHLFDLVIISTLCFCLIRGVFTGLIRELFSVTGVLAGFVFASARYSQVAKWLSYWMPDPSKASLLSFLCIFFGFTITITVLGRLVKPLLKIVLMSSVDRLFGAGVAIIKSVLIVSVLLLTLTAFLPKDVSIIKNSSLSPRFIVVSEKMARIVSKDMRHEFLEKLKVIKKSWENKK